MGGIGSGGDAGGGSSGLTEDTTVTIPAGNTEVEDQALVDAQPKYSNGFLLTFQLADGSRTYSNPLIVEGFENVVVQGNPAESGQHTNQAAVINSSNSEADIIFRGCQNAVVDNIRHNNTNVAEKSFVRFEFCPNFRARGNYHNAAQSIAGSGVYVAYGGSGDVTDNSFTLCNSGIYANITGVLNSVNNVTVTTAPGFGLVADRGSIVAKTGTQPGGTISPETTGSGGQVL
jgi:hypothetical protein